MQLGLGLATLECSTLRYELWTKWCTLIWPEIKAQSRMYTLYLGQINDIGHTTWNMEALLYPSRVHLYSIYNI